MAYCDFLFWWTPEREAVTDFSENRRRYILWNMKRELVPLRASLKSAWDGAL
jgi:hypothetical protein